MILKYMSQNIRTSLGDINIDEVREIRIRLNKPIFIILIKSELKIGYIPTLSDIEETFSRVCRFSPYAYIEEIKRGYITVEGGCRVGICGNVVAGRNIKDITSLNFRIAREVIDCSKDIIERIKGNVLIASPPGCGKTTILRDIIRQWSNSGKNIGVADERGEISGGGLDLGDRTDVMLNCPKTKAMEMLLRSMSPNVIAVDELGGAEDIKAAWTIIHSGVILLATIHSATIEEVKYKIKDLPFDYIVFLKGTGIVDKIYNKEYALLW